MTAAWAEAVVASCGQPTLVYFHGDVRVVTFEGAARLAATQMALSTGARVFTLAVDGRSDPPGGKGVQAGVTAYRWLLGEGCDTTTTAFIANAAGVSTAAGVLRAVSDGRGLAPAGGVWRVGRSSPELARLPGPSRLDLRSQLVQVGASELLSPAISFP